MIEKFLGTKNKQKRINALSEQYIINGSSDFAAYFADNCEVLGYSKGIKLIEQDGTDSDLYFIIMGSVDIVVNDRPIAIRNKHIHVGEMALLDDTTKRSAVVIAREDTVVFKVTQAIFSTYANSHPELWQRMAIELSSRLRERSRFIKTPNSKPMVFIGSSSEQLERVKLIKELIIDSGIDVKSWDENDLFSLSESTLDELIEILENYDFALFYISGDDKLESRGTTFSQPRDNVILELGMAIGALGKKRSFILVEEDSKPNLPTDLKGVTYLPISFDDAKLSDHTTAQIKEKLIARIFSDGVK